MHLKTFKLSKMKSVFSVFLKFLGILVLLITISLIVGYRILFDHEMKYYPVEDPEVAENLEDWQSRKFGLFMHWGPYSQWGVVESWSICSEDRAWTKRNIENYEEYKRRYQELPKTFNPVRFSPEKWARESSPVSLTSVSASSESPCRREGESL